MFWLIGHRVTIPPRVQDVLRYAPACALAAIVGPDLVLGPPGDLQLDLGNPKLLAGLAALATTCGAATCCKPSFSACWC